MPNLTIEQWRENYKHTSDEYYRYGLIYKVSLPKPDKQLVSDAYTWCENNLGPVFVIKNPHHNWTYMLGEFYFKNQDDAALFRIRWC